jgi:peptidoglycan hydrolase-like protein with peptidoglycan-binding domain
MLKTRKPIAAILIAAFLAPAVVAADELTQIIQQDLMTLGYDPGGTNGEATVETVVAISKFQAEHDLEVTGEASPQLAGVIKAAINQGSSTAGARAQNRAASAAPAAQSAIDEAALKEAQSACLQQKAVEAQESQQRRRGFARLARAVTRGVSRMGGDDLSRDVAQLSRDVYDANAIASDLTAAAEDLGLSASDIEDCRNP